MELHAGACAEDMPRLPASIGENEEMQYKSIEVKVRATKSVRRYYLVVKDRCNEVNWGIMIHTKGVRHGNEGDCKSNLWSSNQLPPAKELINSFV